MSALFAERKQARETARMSGQTIFNSPIPCNKCGSYRCYTNQKSYRCVDCHLNKLKQKTINEGDKVRAQRRESYNNNRPAYNAETMMFKHAKQVGFLEVIPRTQEELEQVEMMCDILKDCNGDESEYVLDHIDAKGGFMLNGEKIYGRTVQQNLRFMTKEENAKKSNKTDTENKEFNPMVHVRKDDSVTLVEGNASTEFLRELTANTYQLNTRRNGKNYVSVKKDKMVSPEEKPFKEKLSLYDVHRRYLVLELMLGGMNKKYLFNEPHPLRDIWDDVNKKYYTPQVRVQDGLHTPEAMKEMYEALRWIDAVKDCIYWHGKGMPLDKIYGEDDILQRVEQHFIEWVDDWSRNKRHVKSIYDFTHIPSKQEREEFKLNRFKSFDENYIPPAEKITVSENKVKVITQAQATDMLELFGYDGYQIVSDDLFNHLPTTPYFYRFM
ncbi:hypothetical protein F9Q47_23430 [Salmonella enterica subsp. enterica serovar Typhimurium]|nr:hypothetical protein [Salmonella enterica subsp. enterica serovar Typhimurium]